MSKEKIVGKDIFKNFFHLAANRKEGVDYSIVTREVPGSNVAIVAPHGGIETGTIAMAKAIAANDFNLYLFNSLRSQELYDAGGNWHELHITSIHFDEPRCLELVGKTDVTLTVHGSRIKEPVVCLSSMDKKLESKLSAAFNKAGVKVLIEGHPYQSGKLPENICNRNRKKQGVQLEFSQGIRDNPALRETCVRVVRESLKGLTA